MKKAYQICSSCVMDTSDQEIVFDKDGVCNHCYAYKSRVQKDLHLDEMGQRHLESIVGTIKEKYESKKYDCLIGVSGGVDSTYVAYLAKKRFGLRPLAVHFDNGWNSELAVKNIEKTLNHLDIDLITYVVDWREFRDIQLSFIKASVVNWEIPTDHSITALLYRIAAKENIKYILGGGNIATEAIMPMSWVFYARDLRHIKSVHRRFGEVPMKTFPTMSMKRFLYYTFARGIKWFPILNYVDYNKDHSMKVIEQELGWKYYGGKHYESIFTRFYQGYALVEKFGIDKRRAHLSTLVNSNQLSRDQAISQLEEPSYDLDQYKKDFQFFLKKFELSEAQFKELFDKPVQPHNAYGSSAIVFEKFAGKMSAVKKFATANVR